jgi:hypothetical protein
MSPPAIETPVLITRARDERETEEQSIADGLWWVTGAAQWDYDIRAILGGFVGWCNSSSRAASVTFPSLVTHQSSISHFWNSSAV